MLEDYKVIYHAQLAPSFFNPSNPFRGGVYSFGAYFAGKSDVRDHYDMSQNGGVNLSDFIVGLNWSDSVNAPYSNATITLKIPDDLQNYYLPGTKPFRAEGQIKYQDIMFNQRSNPLANFFFKQMKTGAWITIHHPLLKSERDDEKVYPACFFGKLTGISYSILSDELGQTTYTNITLQCESFIQTLIESQFRVRMSENSLGILQESAAIQRRSGGTPSQQSAQAGTYGTSEWIGSLPPNNLMSVTEWINYILNPLIALSNSNKSLGYLFEKFSKLFAAQMVPQSVITPQPVKEGSISGGSQTRVLADCFIVNYSHRHSIGTKWENYYYSLGQATNFKAVGSAVGKSSIWRWLLDTFAVDSATIECFPLLVAPRGSTKEQRDQQVSKLIRSLVSNSSKSNYAQAKLPQDRIDLISQGLPPGTVPAELGAMLQATQDVARFAQMITPQNPFPDFSDTIGGIDGLLSRRGNPVVFNEFDNDIIKAIVIRDMYLSLGVIPTIFYRLKPLAPGMFITKDYMVRASVENSPLQQAVGSAYGTSEAEELRYFETASEKVKINEYESGTPLTQIDRAFAEGPQRTVDNYALIDPDYWLGASFNYSESRRVNGIFFDSVFTSADDTLFSLDALEVVPNPIIDSEDVKKDGFRVYEGSFPFLQTPVNYTAGTPLTDDQRKQMLALPQAMAERAFMLLGKDHEYSSGVISLVYHENWDITPGIYGVLPLGDYKLPKDLEDFGGYKIRQQQSEAESLEVERRAMRTMYEEEKAAGELPYDGMTWDEYWALHLKDADDPNANVTVYGARPKGVIPDDKFFEFYIDSVDREIAVDQETGKVSGMIHITYSRGSIGRKQNLFRYHDFALDSAME